MSGSRPDRGRCCASRARPNGLADVFWRLTYAISYRTGRAPWDTGVTPPEVVDLIEGATALPRGRALDLGCGTGTNVRYLAEHRWEAAGVEADVRAYDAARERVADLDAASVF